MPKERTKLKIKEIWEQMECYLFVFPVDPTRFLSNHDAFDLFVGWGMTYMAEKEMRKGKYPLS